MIGSSLRIRALLVLTTVAHAARIQRKERLRCLKVLKVNYCPAQITEYLLGTVGGKDEDSFACMNQFCDAEGADSQCCKVKDAIKKDLQNPRLTSGIKPDILQKLRNAVGLPSSPEVGPIEEPSKPIWEIEAEKKADVESSTKNSSISDGNCMCQGGLRNRGSYLKFEKRNLFSMSGECTSSTACNECYRGDGTGVYGCCLQNANGAYDCAPEFKSPKFNGESCLCGGLTVFKSALFEQGAKHCFPTTDCKVCKSSCSGR